MFLSSQKKRVLLVSPGIIILFTWLIFVPAGTWLKARAFNPPASTMIDSVYLVAGARDMERRIEKVIDIIHNQKSNVRKVLIPDDRQAWKWSKKAGRNLSVTEWAKERIEDEMMKIYGASVSQPELRIVTGSFAGTDTEMEVLADFLKSTSDIHSLVIVTSPYHARRAYYRLTAHLAHARHTVNGIKLFVASPDERFSDRLPWITLSELVKIVRDWLGLSRLPFISRHKIKEYL